MAGFFSLLVVLHLFSYDCFVSLSEFRGTTQRIFHYAHTRSLFFVAREQPTTGGAIPLTQHLSAIQQKNIKLTHTAALLFDQSLLRAYSETTLK
jgi:hypothetical protein